MTWHDKWLSLFAWIYSRKCTQQLLKKSFITDFCPPCTWFKSSQTLLTLFQMCNQEWVRLATTPRLCSLSNLMGQTLSPFHQLPRKRERWQKTAVPVVSAVGIYSKVEKLKLKKNIISRKANAQKTSTLNIFSSEWSHHDSGCSTKCEWDPSLGIKTTLCQPPTT